MSEINENVQNETQATAENQQQIVIEEGGKVKKVIKWVIGGVGVIVTGIVGYLFGKSDKDDDDPAEAEGPKDE